MSHKVHHERTRARRGVGRLSLTALIAALSLILAACGSGSKDSGPNISSAPPSESATTLASIYMSSEGQDKCVGAATVPITRDWSAAQKDVHLSDERYSNVSITAGCDNRSRYLVNEPGLKWDLTYMIDLTYGAVARQNGPWKTVDIDGHPGFAFDWSANGSRWIARATIIEDHLVGLEARIPDAVFSPELFNKVDLMLSKATLSIN